MIDFADLFVRSTGESLYFFAIIVISFACLFMVISQSRSKRDALAFSGVVLVWVLLLAGSLLTYFTDYDAVDILPPLERFAVLMTTLLLSWTFLRHFPGWLMALLGGVVVVGYGATALRWLDLAGQMDFNLSAFGVTWTFMTGLVAILGTLASLLYLRSVTDAPLKFVFYAIIAAGFGVTLVQIAQGNIIGDYAGLTRLSFVTALLIVPVLVYRDVMRRYESALEATRHHIPQADNQTPNIPAKSKTVQVSPVERESVQLLRTLGLILEEATAADVPDKIIHSVIEVLKIDVVALLRVKDANYVDVTHIYDKVLERTLSGVALNLDNQPTLANAIERRQQQMLTIEDNKDEIDDLYVRFDVDEQGLVYFQPLVHDKKLIAILACALPYTKRRLMSAEEDMLRGIGVLVAGLLSLSDAARASELQAEERAIQEVLRNVQSEQGGVRGTLTVAREQIAELSKQVMQLKAELDAARSRAARDLGDTEELMSASQRILALDMEQQRIREERDTLAARLQEAEAALSGATASDDKEMMANLVESLQTEKENLQAEKARLQAQLDEIHGDDGLIPQAIMQTLMDQVAADQQRLEAERDSFKQKLVDIQQQLKAVGIEGDAAGLAKLIGRLYEQRAALQRQNKAMRSKLEQLLGERTRLQVAIDTEEARAMRLQSLEVEVENLAGDREALNRQLDQLRGEREKLKEQIERVKAHRARLLAQSDAYEMELKESHEEQAALREKMQKLVQDRQDLLDERDKLVAARQALQTDYDQLMARVEGDRDRLAQVGTQGVGSLTQMVDDLTRERNRLHRELQESRDRLATVQNEIDAIKLQAGDANPNGHSYSPDPEVLLGLVQEFRTPMTSITGYVDLLLSESSGILGQMQRKFLQRVLTNVQRLSIMLEDLVSMTRLDSGTMHMKPASVDVVRLIDDVIARSSTQFREKNLVVNLDMNYEMPPVETDKDALTQIVDQLLNNASLVSMQDGEIFVTVQPRQFQFSPNEKPIDCLYIAVEDRGGGILPEDAERVFTRKYKADNPLIAGLGDTGVGLAMARALAEAQGGRLWMKSKPNVGTTFHFALPQKSAVMQSES